MNNILENLNKFTHLKITRKIEHLIVLYFYLLSLNQY